MPITLIGKIKDVGAKKMSKFSPSKLKAASDEKLQELETEVLNGAGFADSEQETIWWAERFNNIYAEKQRRKGAK